LQSPCHEIAKSFKSLRNSGLLALAKPNDFRFRSHGRDYSFRIWDEFRNKGARSTRGDPNGFLPVQTAIDYKTTVVD
jgi:hypothetical protein